MVDVHPNGPRTFATRVRDAIPLPREIIDRLSAVDTGHPTLTALVHALGLDFNANAADAAARAAWPAAGEEQGLAEAVDAWYGAVRSPRMVRVNLDDGGLEVAELPARVVVRDGEFSLWVVARNGTASPVSFTVNDTSWEVQAGRLGSSLVVMRAVVGLSELPLTVAAAGESAVVRLSLDVLPTSRLRVPIVDDETGEAVAARVYLRDGAGIVAPPGAVLRRDVHGNAFFHADGGFEVDIAGTAHVRVLRGIEYEQEEREIAATPGEGAHIDAQVRLRRFSHAAKDGWYSGDVHVHLHYGGEYLLTREDASLTQRGEDVHFMNMMVANQGSGWVHDVELFSGSDDELSDGEHILRWGEEYRNNFYGHMCMFGIRELVPPIYSGFPNSEHAHDLPANAEAAAHAHAVGGALSYAHPMFESIELDRVFAAEHRLSVEAKELPVDAALGHIDAVDILAYPANTKESCALWYRLLNCGLRLAATAGTDTFMNTQNSGMFSNPPAGDRVFVHLDGPLTTEAWCDGVRRGRTFVTNGPMLRFTVDGHEASSRIAHAGGVLRVEGSVTSAVPVDKLELVVNGEVVASADVVSGAASISHDLRVATSCWVALRCHGPRDERVLDPEGAFAHTCPIYVDAGGPVKNAGDAAYFVEWIERLIAVTEERARFPSAGERERVVALFREGQAYYRGITGS